MSATPVPDSLSCRICSSLLVSAVTFPCCGINLCRGCAIRQIIRYKSCGNNTYCGKEISVTDLRPNRQMRELCLEFKEKQSTEENREHLKSLSNSSPPTKLESQAQEHTKENSHSKEGGVIEEINIEGSSSTNLSENQAFDHPKEQSKEDGIIKEYDYDGPDSPNLLIVDESESQRNEDSKEPGENIEKLGIGRPDSLDLLESKLIEHTPNEGEGTVEELEIEGSVSTEKQPFDNLKEQSIEEGIIEECNYDGSVSPNLLEVQSNEHIKEHSDGGGVVEEIDNEDPASPNLLEYQENEDSKKHDAGNMVEFGDSTFEEGGMIEEYDINGSTLPPKKPQLFPNDPKSSPARLYQTKPKQGKDLDAKQAQGTGKREQTKMKEFWKCPLCLHLFPCAKKLEGHLDKLGEKHDKSCGQCSYMFQTISALKKHESEQHGKSKGVRPCEQCMEVVEIKSMTAHMKKSHQFDCGVDGCDAVCTSDAAKWEHRIKVHDEGLLMNKDDLEARQVAIKTTAKEDKQVDEKDIVRINLNPGKGESGSLDKSKKKIKSPNESSGKDGKPLPKKPTKRGNEAPVNCSNCPASYLPQDRGRYAEHVARDHNVGPCPHCLAEVRFVSVARFFEHHQINHVGEDCDCIVDPVTVKRELIIKPIDQASPNLLESQLNEQAEEYSNTDPEIQYKKHGKRTSKRDRVKIENYWRCPLCLRLFFNAQELKNHIDMTGEKHDKSCDQCSCRFPLAKYLIIHGLEKHGVIGKGVRQCISCKEVFQGTRRFSNHMRSNHKVDCGADGCDAVCINATALWKHRINIHDEGVLVNKEDFQLNNLAEAENNGEGNLVGGTDNNSTSLNPFYRDPHSPEKSPTRKRKISEEQETVDKAEVIDSSDLEDSSSGGTKRKKQRTRIEDEIPLEKQRTSEIMFPEDTCEGGTKSTYSSRVGYSDCHDKASFVYKKFKEAVSRKNGGINNQTKKGDTKSKEAGEHPDNIHTNENDNAIIWTTSETIEDTPLPSDRPLSPMEETRSTSGHPVAVSPIGDCSPCDLDILRRCRDTSLTLSACAECPAYFVTCSEGPRSVSVPPGNLISLVAMVSEDLVSHKDLLTTGAVKILGHHSPGLKKQLARERRKRKQSLPLPYPAVRPMYGKYLMVTVVNNSSDTQVYQRGMELGQVQLMRGLLPVLELPKHPLPMTLSKKMVLPPFKQHTDLTLTTSLPPGIHVRLILSRSIFPDLRFTLGGSWDEVNVVQLEGKVNVGVINTSTTRLVLETNATVAWGTVIHPHDWIKDRLTLGRLS